MTELDSEKWKIFTPSLKKVQMQVHPTLSVSDEALTHIESLIINLLGTISAARPNSMQDVKDIVKRTFPKTIEEWAIKEADTALEKKKNNKKGEKSVTLPVDKVHPLLKELLGYRLDIHVSTYIVAVLEYVAADILKLVGNYVRNIHGCEITLQDVRVSMLTDKVLNSMFSSCEDSDGEMPTPMINDLSTTHSASDLAQTYEDIVKDLILYEQQFIRELELIIKVFRAPFVELFPHSKDIDVIFSNILDVHSFSLDLLGSLEDTVEITEQNQLPLIGGCFEEMTENVEFAVYEKYMEDVMKPQLKDRLNALLERTDLTEKLQSYDPSFKIVVKYLLPKLLLSPIYHLQHCLEVMEKLKDSSQSTEDDHESFNQAIGLLVPLKRDVDSRIAQLHSESPMVRRRTHGSITDRMSTSARIKEVQKSIENWDDKDIDQLCNDFIMQGFLDIHQNKKDRERFVFLFDNMILLCKSTGKRNAYGQEYRFKEKHMIRHLDVMDSEHDDLKDAFELHDQNQTVTILRARSINQKAEWMAALLSLLFRSNLDRMLDAKLQDEESKQALILPPVKEYPFSEEDSDENILLEDSSGQTAGDPPLIQGATLNKLVERLTYHMYADPKFVRRFLTTYRSFCSPKELLELLISRFQIPENSEIYVGNKEGYKRFKKDYVKPVQFRVLNVIRHWADHHFYDFERDEKLLPQLEKFLDTIKGKVMRKWVDSILKILRRKCETSTVFQGVAPGAELPQRSSSTIQFNDDAPNTEWHIATKDEIDKFNILTLHPVEVARQETLVEFKLYRSVKPSELVGSVFTKKDKDQYSPNLMKLIHQTNRFIYWLELSLLSTKNLEERVAVLSRIIEIMLVFRKLNNFNGMLCVKSALDSAPIHRLSCTFEQLQPKFKKSLEEAKELPDNNYKKYFEVLRAIDPPCVPFFGVYMTNILKLEEGNPDCLPHTDLINFSKRRKVADITGEIQQYQNTMYNLTAVDSIQEYLETFDPWEGREEHELHEHLYDISLEIEPRNIKIPPKFPRMYEATTLKSPGVHAIHSKSKANTFTAFRSHLASISSSSSSSETKFTFKPAGTDEEDSQSVLSMSTSPNTPNTPITPPPMTPPPRTPPAARNYTPPPRTPPHYNSLYNSESSFYYESQASIFSNSSTATVVSMNHSCQDVNDGERYELQAPPLPPRRSVTSLNLPPDPPPPELPPKPQSRERDMADPPRLPPRPSRSNTRPIERSGSMPSADYRYCSRRNSGDHVNVNPLSHGTPQLPPRTYKLIHGRQRSQ